MRRAFSRSLNAQPTIRSAVAFTMPSVGINSVAPV